MTLPGLIDSLGSTDAEQAVEFATALVREWCGWHIAPALSEVRRLDGDGTTILLLPSLHVTAVDHVVTASEGELTDVTWSENGVLARVGVAETDPWAVLAGTANTVLLRPRVFPAGLGTVTVDFTHGYDETPAAVRAVVTAVARRLLGTGSGVPIVQEGAGGVQRIFGIARNVSPAFTAVEAMVLDRYKLPKAA